MSLSGQARSEQPALDTPRSPGGAFLLRPMIQELANIAATEVPGRDAGQSPLVVVDVDRGHTVDADAGTVRRVLGTIIRDAIEAASVLPPQATPPKLREVVITSVRTADAVEIEIASSACDAQETIGMAAASARAVVERLGGRLLVHRCPEGGRAITVSFPQRRSSEQTSGGGLRRAA